MKIQHEQLLAECRSRDHHSNRQFISDGAIDPVRWGNKRKVLFLLKEAYDNDVDRQDWDLCEAIREKWKGPKYKIWHLVAKWCYGIQEAGEKFPSLLQVESASPEHLKEAFLSAAVVNIKKSDGSSKSDMDDLRWFYERDKDVLKKQVELLAPEIIICGYTWDIVRELWSDAKRVERCDLVWDIPGLGKAVDFWHPANQYPNLLNYHCLLSVLSQAGAFWKPPQTECK
jgi:hypothetical protein